MVEEGMAPTQSKLYSPDEQVNAPPSPPPVTAWAQQPTAFASLLGVRFAGQVQLPASKLLGAGAHEGQPHGAGPV